MVSAQRQSAGEHDTADALSQAIVQGCPCGIAVFDEVGVIAFANPELERMFEYALGEARGQSIDALIQPALPWSRAQRQPRTVLDAATGCDPAPRTAVLEACGTRKLGGELAVEVRLTRLPAPGRGWLAIISDIERRKQQERETQQRIRELEQSNSDLEQFASIASHDLREPLRMIVSYTELLAERYRGQLDEKADKFIRYTVQGATRMQRLIDDLLAYARLENPGRPSLPTAVGDALRDTLCDMRVLIQDSGAQISHGPLPTVLVDPVQLAQLLQNLIHNAIKFRREEPPLIRLTAERQAGMWRIALSDNGIGIERRYQDRIFQMFQRLHERSKYDGSGIGLATARKIVERHGGSIALSSTPGQGSTFFFTLPAAPTCPGSVEGR